ncbi:hypothetical protein K435DRAFT_773452 [Dendrothele bispora CBS 962.96]|uniref:Uncharacterized protein n=1 Tax=Dendrothele bispora (strain CBS 962.96) TaxID=1314807 RepID=A0A4S8MTM0_DENBC|nr:hypothetical protein K435DRAFT_773452 [Dendrothele bispora CBS 962.96]
MGKGSPAPQDTYPRVLLYLKHGYPLWIPEPSGSLPDDLFARGIEPGDVGWIDGSGYFTSLFNIFCDKDDPVNIRHGVPQGFEPLKKRGNLVDKRENFHKAKVPICSKETRTVAVDATGTAIALAPLQLGAGVQLQFSTQCGAALILPDGASRYDYLGRRTLREYAVRNAESWYQFLIDELGISADNGSLYLITGCDKTRCYQNIAFSNASKEFSVSVQYSSPIADGRLAVSYSTSTEHMPSSRASGPGNTTENLSVFIRGFKIMLRRGPASLLKSAVKVMDVTEADPKDIMYRGPIPNYRFNPSGNSFGSSSSSQSPPPSTTPSSSRLDRSSMGTSHSESPVSLPAASNSTSVTSLDSPEDSMNFDSSFSERGSSILDSNSDHEEAINQFSHPSDVINQYMLETFPDALVAITHDEEWLPVLDNMDDQFPDECLLLSYIKENFRVDLQQGHVHLEKYSPNQNFLLKPLTPLGKCMANSIRRLFGVPSRSSEYAASASAAPMYSPTQSYSPTTSRNKKPIPSRYTISNSSMISSKKHPTRPLPSVPTGLQIGLDSDDIRSDGGLFGTHGNSGVRDSMREVYAGDVGETVQMSVAEW